MAINIPTNFWDLSAILIIMSAVLLYFGKIISDTKVDKYNKIDLVTTGLAFSIIFLALPLAIIIYLFQNNLILNIPNWSVIVIQLSILFLYTKYYTYKLVIFRGGLTDEYNKRFKNKMQKIKEKSLVGKIVQKRPYIEKSSLQFFDKVSKLLENNKILFILSFCVLYPNIISFFSNNSLFFFINIVLTYTNISLLAVAFGFSTAYYPKSKITLTNGKTITGRTLKFGEFIYLITKNKKYFINKDQVTTIEQDIMKK